MVADIPAFGSVSSALAVPHQPPAPRSSRNLLILDRSVTADIGMMYHHASGPQAPGPQQMYLKGKPGSLPHGNDPPAAGITQTGPVWVQLKTYSTQPGPPYRGVRFNRMTNTWGAMVSYKGREVEISCHEHEEEAALAHDRRVLELFGAGSRVNFQYSGLVDRGTMRVLGLRSADGTEIPFRTGGGGGGEQGLSGMSPSHTPPARLPPSPGGTAGVEDTPGAGRWDGERHVTPVRQLPRAPGMGVEGPREEPWAAAEGSVAARPDPGPPAAAAAAAAAASDHPSANVAKAGDHDDAGLVYEIAFPQPGALGLNLRTYLAEQPAGARLGLPPYGSLEVLDAQKFYLKASDR
ncbi:unnamed protein product [Ectocarpus sp. CCAP 1310/34]|nr:unnamed protein product [Ectocarpus sp. CCAP 1310/34]